MAAPSQQAEPVTFGGYGLTLLRQGYPVLPITPRTKRPLIRGWQSLDIDRAQIGSWATIYPDHGIGIRLGEHLGTALIAVDVDVMHKPTARHLVDWCRGRIGPAPLRAGQAPKGLILLRCTEPVRKMYARKFRSPDGREHRVEVLGEGQQCVAYGIHPDGRPYRWHDGEPLTVAADDLPEVTPELLRELLDEFETVAEAAGWDAVARARHETTQGLREPPTPMGVAVDELRDALAVIPADDYHAWINYGMALYHESGGGDIGLDLWDEWSSKSDSYPGRDVLETKWNSFAETGAAGTITARSIFRTAQEVAHQLRQIEHHRQANELTITRLPDLDFELIPPRRWVLGRRLMAHYITATFAPGGVAKSTLALLTAVSVATGRNLTGEEVYTPGRAWILNNEDDIDELYRRLAGICVIYGIQWRELQENLTVTSGYGHPYVIATETLDGQVRAHPNVDRIIREIEANGVVYLCVDPLISTHDTDENDNASINRVVDQFKHIASDTGAAIELIHHTRKGGADSEAHAGQAEAGRGASALKDAARIAVTLARMSHASAREYGLDWSEGRRMIRLDTGKANFALPDEEATWLRLETASLPNGDTVGVPVPFDMSSIIEARDEAREAERNATAGQWRIDIVEAMVKDRMRRSTVTERLMASWELADRATRGRIMQAIPFDRGNAAQVETADGAWWLWLEREGGATTPVTVRRARIGLDEG